MASIKVCCLQRGATLLLISLLSTQSQAEDWLETCKVTSELAYDIMASYQLGAPMEKVMTITDGSTLIESMIIEAYKKPRHLSVKLQEKAKADYRDEWFLLCVTENSPQPQNNAKE